VNSVALFFSALAIVLIASAIAGHHAAGRAVVIAVLLDRGASKAVPILISCASFLSDDRTTHESCNAAG